MATEAERSGRASTRSRTARPTRAASARARSTSFATRGMMIRRACDPEGTGTRGPDHRQRRPPRATVERGAVAHGDDDRARRNAVHELPLGRTARRDRDCRYALQLYAEAPDGIKPIAIKNVRANRGCPRRGRAPAGRPPSRTFNVTGATRIVQRVICVGGTQKRMLGARRRTSSARTRPRSGSRTSLAPTASVLADTPLARGEWVGGTQPLNYDASDNVGVRQAEAIVAEIRRRRRIERPCTFATPEQVYADRVPCPNGPGQIERRTRRASRGHPAARRAGAGHRRQRRRLASGDRADRQHATGRVDVGVEGGDAWRNRNDFALAWTNPPEGDRAPIAGVSYKLCAERARELQPRRAGRRRHLAAGDRKCPAAGEWTVSLWRRDAAGNETEAAASVPVTLRYDPEPPQLAFEPPTAGDPTLVGRAGDRPRLRARERGDRDQPERLGRLAGAPDPEGRAADCSPASTTPRYRPAATCCERAPSDQARQRGVDRPPGRRRSRWRSRCRCESSRRMRAGFERTRTVRRTVRRDGKRVRSAAG